MSECVVFCVPGAVLPGTQAFLEISCRFDDTYCQAAWAFKPWKGQIMTYTAEKMIDNNPTDNVYTPEVSYGYPEHCELGNPELPIADYRREIIGAVDSSQVTIITAETGAGKSTQVPQFLAEEGYNVIVTQPRVVAARSVAERVQSEVVDTMGRDFKDFVGYRTAK